MKIELRDPAELRPHATLAALPMLAEDDAEFGRLCDSILAHGIQDPLKITADGRVADGRHRWKAARAAQLRQVPCIIVPEEEAATIALESLLRRRHLTPGQRAYMAAPLFERAFEEAKNRKLTNLKNGGKFPERNSVAIGEKTPADWAEHLGVTRELLRQANELRKFFYGDPWKNQPISFSLKTGSAEMGGKEGQMTLREYFEPLILADEDPMGLGSALKGIGMKLKELDDAARGRKHAGGRPEEPQRQLELFCDVFVDLHNRFEYWTRFSESEKLEAGKAIMQSLQAMPDDLLDRMYRSLRKLVKARKDDTEGKP